MRMLTAVVVAALATTAVPVVRGEAPSNTVTLAKHDKFTGSISGTVVGFKRHKLTISWTDDQGRTEEKAIKINSSTTVTLDGGPSTVQSLRSGYKVSVNIADGVATEIDATVTGN